MPYIGKAAVSGIRKRFTFLASAGATSISGADANGQTLTFDDGTLVDVFLNGVKLKTGEDYNTSTANTIAGLTALNLNDEVEILAYDTFSSADAVSKRDGGTFDNAISVTGNITTTGTLQLQDADESITSDGSKVIITSGGTAFSLPTSDGSSGQFIKTNGSGVLSFDTVSSAADDITVGDSAVTISTTSGNITIDATANDSDVIIKGTDSTADITMATFDGSDAGTLILNHDLELGTDASVVKFGVDNEITLTHVHNEGLTLKNTLATDSTPAIFSLTTGETAVEAGDILGQIKVSAPDEATGSDAILTAGEIRVTAEAAFDATNNGASLRFYTGNSADTGATATDCGLEISRYGNVYTGKGARYYAETAPTSTPSQGFLNLQMSPQFQNGITVVANSTDNSTTRKVLETYTSDGTARGNISLNGSNGVTAFNTSSDYRLKENIVNITDGITSVKKLTPKRFSWKNSSASELYEGFLAHEVAESVPNSKAVDGDKDAVIDGNPVYQGMDYSRLVPILTAALKEAITKIETLETKVATLESGG